MFFSRLGATTIGLSVCWMCFSMNAQAQDTSGSAKPRRPFVTPEMTSSRTDVAPFEYVDVGARIPNYPPSDEWGLQAEPMTKMQRPLSPQESIKHFVTPTGFQVKRYASEPELGGKPIAMNWDEQGRLWVCESYDYPNELQPPGQGRDRIRICRDTDKNGVADTFTVFAEQLSIPTAIAFYRGGAIVQNGVETLYLKDTDGDDKADVRKVLLSNWELGDTHGGVSNFRYGLDNWFWGMQGYNESSPRLGGADSQEQQSFRMGFFRFQLDDQDPPQVTKLEFIRSTDNNTWGLGITEEGLITGSTANRNPSTFMPLANRYYERVRGWSPTQLGSMADNHLFSPITNAVRQVDHHGGYTAAAGHAIYTARVYPQQYWNRTAFVCGPTGHLVGTFVLEQQGAGMKSHSPCNLLASTDEWTAPIAAEIGPDGNVWVLDWYNFIVQHNPTPRGFDRGAGNAYETDLRDKKYGRIYRVDYAGNEAAKAWSSLKDASPQALVDALRHPTMTWRLHAQRLLVEGKHTSITPALVALINNPDVDAIGQNNAAMHALWTLEGLHILRRNDTFTQSLARTALQHPVAGVRRSALAAIPLDDTTLKEIFGSSPNPLDDADTQVRLAALQALADHPHPHEAALDAIQRALGNPSITADPWLRDALLSAASVHGVLAGWFVDGHGKAAPEFVTKLAEHAARGRMDSPTWTLMLERISQGPAALANAAVDGLSAGWPQDHPIRIAQTADGSLERVLQKLALGSQGKLVRLAQFSGSRALDRFAKPIADSLSQAMRDEASTEEKRLEAAAELMALQPTEEVAQAILELIRPQASPEFSAGLLRAVLGQATSDKIGSRLLERLPEFTPQARRAAVNELLKRPETTTVLLQGIANRALSIDDLPLEQRQSLSQHPVPDIRKRWTDILAASGGLPDADRQKVIDEVLSVTQEEGDAANGRRVFQQQCSKCHVHGSMGQALGPNLTGMSVHPKEELLVHILDPSRSVEGNFRQYTVVTSNGVMVRGMLATESKTALEIVDTEAKRHAIARSDIDLIQGSSKSVMPEGFEKLISKSELRDLLEFLTEKGRFVPLPLDKVVTAISTRGLFDGGEAGAHRIFSDHWGTKVVRQVPFQLIDPVGKSLPNVILLHGPQGTLPPTMPKQVELPVNMRLQALHLLSGIGVQCYPETESGTTTLTVRFHYAGGDTEDHALKNGIHFADCSRRVDVPGSEFAFKERGRQVRYLAVTPRKDKVIERVEFLKGDDTTAPIIVAVTLESR